MQIIRRMFSKVCRKFTRQSVTCGADQFPVGIQSIHHRQHAKAAGGRVFPDFPGKEMSMALSRCSMDGYVSESGEVMTVLEIALDWLDPAYDEGLLEKMQEEPQYAGLFQERLHEAQELRSLVQSIGGRVAISVPYTVTIYSPDDLQMHNSARQNTISFEMEIR